MNNNSNPLSRDQKEKLAKIKFITTEYNRIMFDAGQKENIIVPGSPIDILITLIVKHIG